MLKFALFCINNDDFSIRIIFFNPIHKLHPEISRRSA